MFVHNLLTVCSPFPADNVLYSNHKRKRKGDKKMFFVMDNDTNEVLATTRFENVANKIAKSFGIENCIVRYAEISSKGLAPVFLNTK